jgi:DNA primase
MKQAAEFIKSRYKVDISSFTEDYINRIKRYEDFYNIEKPPRKVRPLYTIAAYQSGYETYQYFYDRGFDDDIVEWFQIGYDTVHRTVTIPVFWEDYTLAGVIGRYINPRSKAERYHVYDDFKRGSLLFPIDKVDHDGEIILVEGQFDCMRLYQWDYRNALASMTSTLTPPQIDYLNKNAESVVLMYDNDAKGQSAQEKIISQLKSDLDLYVVRGVVFDVGRQIDVIGPERAFVVVFVRVKHCVAVHGRI